MNAITLLGSPCRYRHALPSPSVFEAGFISLRERVRSCVEPFIWRMKMDEKRTARLFGLILGRLFAMNLILSAITI